MVEESTVTSMLTIMEAPLTRLPISQVTMVFASLQPALADTTLTPAGSVSVPPPPVASEAPVVWAAMV